MHGEIAQEDLWNLDITLAKLIAAHLREFVKVVNGWPDRMYGTFEEYISDIDLIIRTFEDFAAHSFDAEWNEERAAKMDDALRLFAKLFTTLWW